MKRCINTYLGHARCKKSRMYTQLFDQLVEAAAKNDRARYKRRERTLLRKIEQADSRYIKSRHAKKAAKRDIYLWHTDVWTY